MEVTEVISVTSKASSHAGSVHLVCAASVFLDTLSFHYRVAAFTNVTRGFFKPTLPSLPVCVPVDVLKMM